MSNMYGSLSEVYEMMYQTFINYEEEFDFYSRILKIYNAISVAELGCGTGNLASAFKKNGFSYTGIDASEEMLQMAKLKNPSIDFLLADIRNFKLPAPINACIITGRTISYLINDDDVKQTFQSIHKNLQMKGILCFDAINTKSFLPSIQRKTEVEHEAQYNDRKFKRISQWQVASNNLGTFSWDAEYFERDNQGQYNKIGEDHSVIRCFDQEHLSDMLQQCGFDVLKVEQRSSYAFDTFVITAQKN